MSGVCRLRDGLAMPKSMTDEHELVKKIVILMAPFSWRRRTYATLPAAFVQAGGLHRSSGLQKAQAIRMTSGAVLLLGSNGWRSRRAQTSHKSTALRSEVSGSPFGMNS